MGIFTCAELDRILNKFDAAPVITFMSSHTTTEMALRCVQMMGEGNSGHWWGEIPHPS